MPHLHYDSASAAATVMRDARWNTTRLARRVLLWFGIPITILEVAPTVVSPLGVDGWNLLELVAVVATVILLYRIPARRVRDSSRVLVVGLGAVAVCGIFHSGPKMATGTVLIGWVLATVFYARNVWWPTAVVTATMVVSVYGVRSGNLGFRWEDQWSGSAWLMSVVTVAVTTFAIASAFAFVIDRLERAVRDHAEARRLAMEAHHERELALQTAAQAQRLESLGRLAGGIAHDFNNAVGVLTLALEELRHDPAPEDRARLLDDIGRAARGAQATTRQLLSFARQGSAPGGRCVPGAVVSSMAPSLTRLFPAHIVVRTDAKSREAVDCAVGELEQILLNLCLNARDAMPEGGMLTLRVRDVTALEGGKAATHRVSIEVVDSGCGMDEAVRQRALDPFFTTKPAGVGTGMGLAMVGSSITAMGGSIEIDSAPGAGTTVRLLLPCAKVSATPMGTATVEDDWPEAGAGDTPTILLLEDEPSLRRLLERGLTKAGFAVRTAGNVAEALRELERMPKVSLVLTDAVLPDGGPRPLIERYRQRFPDGRVLVCSGYVPEDVLLEGIESASLAFLQKPFDTATLVANVRQQLDAPLPREVAVPQS
ncbi:MAG: response regulator [Gemmatimonadaceae bacterium]|nr:response regulator [Gemmatimonadaceae bacterium]